MYGVKYIDPVSLEPFPGQCPAPKSFSRAFNKVNSDYREYPSPRAGYVESRFKQYINSAWRGRVLTSSDQRLVGTAVPNCPILLLFLEKLGAEKKACMVAGSIV